MMMIYVHVSQTWTSVHLLLVVLSRVHTTVSTHSAAFSAPVHAASPSTAPDYDVLVSHAVTLNCVGQSRNHLELQASFRFCEQRFL